MLRESVSIHNMGVFRREICMSLCADNGHKKRPLCLVVLVLLIELLRWQRVVLIAVIRFSGLWLGSRSGEILPCLFSVLSQQLLSWGRCLLLATHALGVMEDSWPITVHWNLVTRVFKFWSSLRKTVQKFIEKDLETLLQQVSAW